MYVQVLAMACIGLLQDTPQITIRSLSQDSSVSPKIVEVTVTDLLHCLPYIIGRDNNSLSFCCHKLPASQHPGVLMPKHNVVKQPTVSTERRRAQPHGNRTVSCPLRITHIYTRRSSPGPHRSLSFSKFQVERIALIII
jgi:hypothetical protein